MKNPDHVRFTEWDAGYVLGSLSPAERREFEEHLDECDRCRAAVSELSALPGLLGRIDDARAFALLEQSEDPDQSRDAVAAAEDTIGGPAPSTSVDLVARIRERERSQRMRRTLIGVGALAAAAALASVLTLAIPALLTPEPVPSEAYSGFSPVDAQPIPIDVFLKLYPTAWGTRIEMECLYHPTGDNANGAYGPVEYSLWVVGKDGDEHSLSTWNATPGGEVLLDAGTADALENIDRFDLRSADGETVLMTGDVTYRE